MAIEFRCTQCDKLLRTGDETAGKKAKCPECGTVVTVPEKTAGGGQSSTPAGGASSPPASSMDSLYGSGVSPPSSGATPDPQAGNPFASGQGAGGGTNPYTSPTAPLGHPVAAATAPLAAGPVQIEVGDIFSEAWRLFSDNLGNCLLAMLMMTLVSMAVGVVFLIFFFGAIAIGGGAGGGAGAALAIVVVPVGMVVLILFGNWIQAGILSFILRLARGEDPGVGEVFSGARWLLPVTGANLLVGLIVSVGMMLCIVPGVIFGLMFSQCLFLIIDRNVPVMDALSQSRELVFGHKMNIFLVHLLMAGVLILAGCVPFGTFFATPFVWLISAVIYLRLTGQPLGQKTMIPVPPAPATPPHL